MKNKRGNLLSKSWKARFLGVFLFSLLLAGAALPFLLPPSSRPQDVTSRLPPVPEETASSETVTCAALASEGAYRGKNKIFKYMLTGKDGWLFRTSDFRSDFSVSDRALASFESINRSLMEQGVRLVVLLQPPRGFFAPAHMDPDALPKGYDPESARESYRGFLRKLENRGLAVVDLSDVPADAPYFMKGDPHWTPAGARLSAERTASLIQSLSAYESIEKKNFSTRIVRQDKHERGDFETFVLKTCGIKPLPVSVNIWETTAEGQDVGQDSLFGDSSLPSIVALGTSNTENDHELNFIGSLKTLLSADIDNVALAGGGFGGSAVSYFASDSFHENKPKIVLWEFLSHHDFEDFPALRQIEGAVGGSCEKSRTIAAYEGGFPQSAPSPLQSVEGKTPEAQITLFEGLDWTGLEAGDAFLSLDMTDPIIRSVKVGVLYSNGDAEEIDLTRSLRTPNNGKYYLSFDTSSQAVPMLVQLSSNVPEGKVSARICGPVPGVLARKD